MARRPAPIVAETYLQRVESSSTHPALFDCLDGHAYYVKSRHYAADIVSETVVGALATAIGAPVPPTRVVTLAPRLLERVAGLEHMRAGTAHGSREIRAVVGNFKEPMYTTETVNRSRYALLAALFGWVRSGDPQYLYDEDPPFRVYSVDHGRCLVSRGGRIWQGDNPQADAVRGNVDLRLSMECRFTAEEIAAARQRVAAVRAERVADAVAAPPDDWGIDFAERVALARWLIRCQAEVVEP